MSEEKAKKKHVRKLRKLIIFCALIALIFAGATYAWFVGMKTVNVTAFDVKISAIDGLSLSLNGQSWADTVSINEENFNDTENNVVYAGNTNYWGGEGLIPISTIGKIDSGASRLIMFEKGSFSTTEGGFRILASRIQNYTPGQTANTPGTEKDGYVTFDLFVKNLSGHEYYQNMDVLNEEDIYLTTDSAVTVSENGGVANTGIENSVRVAFAQIGRVKADTTDVSTITGISCTTDSNVTGICTDRDAQIWEPNDTAHVANAITWYQRSCKIRSNTGDNIGSYTGNYGTADADACGTVADGTAYPTYAISRVVDTSSLDSAGKSVADVYDGSAYNGYTKNTAMYQRSATSSAMTLLKLNQATGDYEDTNLRTITTEDNYPLVSYPYFTDTMKNLSGTSRPTFIKLAPNSITKIRVYVYIEGQDIDNYDFASLGAKITVAFGFTKERYFDTDVDYDDTDTAELPSDVVKN